MSTIARWVGYAWAAPLTLLGLVYVTLFTFFGWHKRVGRRDNALVWQLVLGKAPSWIDRSWMRWGGHTVGQVVVLKADVDSDRGKIQLKHEQEHVHQCMVFGIFQPILYGFAAVGLMFCRHAHPYYDNPFEIDARRAAGQVVDVIGVLQRALAQGRIQPPSKKAT